METLPGALLSVWIAGCILIAITLSVLAIAALLCTLLQPDVRIPRLEFFSGFVCCIFLAGLFYIHVSSLLAKPQEIPATRDIHLTVPKDSSVNTQITSGNNTVNITDL